MRTDCNATTTPTSVGAEGNAAPVPNADAGPGDVEFESRGSSHSARNVGQAIDVVLVALKP